MMRCPMCKHASHTRASRYLSEQTKEAYYQCQNIECSCTFKSIESVDKIITRPPAKEPEIISAVILPERKVLNRYGSNARIH
ncbi:ogr/Delta-like zinc finger family protein [Yersinia enterocolitica]|uniref:ogr/Delta-like zinc finger family protein n=1 Tax=Yersinia enterocolitica TaxID=630 RepID=UPI0008FF9887|nr:ogr/Delta-like zinc finger family protein [Yersinia enterocolitica]HDL7925063.1 ogr/Delta-like zinc finger family protein [Yersinia enterocolitica]